MPAYIPDLDSTEVIRQLTGAQRSAILKFFVDSLNRCNASEIPYQDRLTESQIFKLTFYMVTGVVPSLSTANKLFYQEYALTALLREYHMAEPEVQELLSPLIEHYKAEFYGEAEPEPKGELVAP